MDPQDPLFDALERTLAASACFVQRYFRFGNWYLEVGGRSYADYLGSLPSRHPEHAQAQGDRSSISLGPIRYEIVRRRTPSMPA